VSETARENNSPAQENSIRRGSFSTGLTEPPALVDKVESATRSLAASQSHQHHHNHKQGRPASASQAVTKLPPLASTSGTDRPATAASLHSVDVGASLHSVDVGAAAAAASAKHAVSSPKPPASTPPRARSRPGSAVHTGQGSSREDGNTGRRRSCSVTGMEGELTGALQDPLSISSSLGHHSVHHEYCPFGHHEVPLVEQTVLVVRRTSKDRHDDAKKERGSHHDDAKKGEPKRRSVPSPPPQILQRETSADVGLSVKHIEPSIQRVGRG